MIAYLVRNRKDTHIDSILLADGHKFDCLELPYLDNKRSVSAIKDGLYPILVDMSYNKNREVIELRDVENRSQIQIHYASSIKSLAGCIGVKIQEEEKMIFNILKNYKYLKIVTLC
jgi:hypothetical protein